MYAGENIDQIAQQHMQITSGERINLHAGHGVAMFAHGNGVSAIANQGKWPFNRRTTTRRSSPEKHSVDCR